MSVFKTVYGLFIPVMVAASGWWEFSSDSDGPWYNSLFVTTPTATSGNVQPMNFSQTCPGNIPLAPLSAVNWQGALHTMQDANGTMWNGHNGYNKFMYFHSEHSMFLSQGAMSYTSITQLYDAYITYATDTVNTGNQYSYGASNTNTQSGFASTLLEFYNVAVNPCFFHIHVWNSYYPSSGLSAPCSLVQDNLASWWSFPFVNLQFEQLPAYSDTFLTMQALAGTLTAAPNTDDTTWECGGAQVWSPNGRVSP